jgi:hypothetical protein
MYLKPVVRECVNAIGLIKKHTEISMGTNPQEMKSENGIKRN